jgi:hypothetical protein
MTDLADLDRGLGVAAADVDAGDESALSIWKRAMACPTDALFLSTEFSACYLAAR